MIGQIRGILIDKQAPEILVEAHGVGYEVQAPMTTIYRLPEIGEELTLHTHLVVREDAHQLFGFFEKEDRWLFRTLIKVNGVGPKLALAILSGMEASQFAQLIHNNDSAALVKLPGVGKKTAERLVIEMRDRLKGWQGEAATGTADEVVPDSKPATNTLVQDAESALVALGYKPQEASRAISACLDESVTSSEELIRLALKGMVQA
jgi:Holliday junction DNA helicase RuvA